MRPAALHSAPQQRVCCRPHSRQVAGSLTQAQEADAGVHASRQEGDLDGGVVIVGLDLGAPARAGQIVGLGVVGHEGLEAVG